MAFSSDHWVAEHGSCRIEIEVYLAGFFTAGASVFINNERVDNVPGFKSSFSRFTLRHNIIHEDRTLEIKVEIVQKLIVTIVTKVALFSSGLLILESYYG